MDGLGLWFDRDGHPITVWGWEALRRDDSYFRVAEDLVGDWWISTVWIGIDYAFGRGPRPVIYETMVFDHHGDAQERWLDCHTERWATAEEARAGHDRIVSMVWELDAAGLLDMAVMPAGLGGDDDDDGGGGELAGV